jgi:hypothetical protein
MGTQPATGWDYLTFMMANECCAHGVRHDSPPDLADRDADLGSGTFHYSPKSPPYLLQIAGWRVWGKEIDVVALIASFLIGPGPCGPADLGSAHGCLPCKDPQIQPQSARVSHRVSPFLALATHVMENDAPQPVVIPFASFIASSKQPSISW